MNRTMRDLWADHVIWTRQYIIAATSDQPDAQAAASRLLANLSGANPNWPRDAVQTMMNEHLALTTKEAVARLKKNWSEDVATFDQIFDQAMMMADTLTNGIVQQFPDRFRS